jgi:hypothetical protein
VRTLAQSPFVDEDDRPAFIVGLFLTRPTFLLPDPDLLLSPLQRPPGGTLTAPSQLPQDAPSLRGMVSDPAFLLDQVRHPPRRPQTGFITQSFRPALQPALDLVQVLLPEARFASGAPRFPQTGQPGSLQLLGPATDRLAMGSDLPRHFGLMDSLVQQPRRPQAPLFTSHDTGAVAARDFPRLERALPEISSVYSASPRFNMVRVLHWIAGVSSSGARYPLRTR